MDEPDAAMTRARELFELSGLTLEELGSRMGYDVAIARQSTWQFLNKTADPRASMLRKFAAAVGVPVAELFLEAKESKKVIRTMDPITWERILHSINTAVFKRSLSLKRPNVALMVEVLENVGYQCAGLVEAHPEYARLKAPIRAVEQCRAMATGNEEEVAAFINRSIQCLDRLRAEVLTASESEG